MSEAYGHDWPCGQVATTAVYERVGGAAVDCEVYGRERWGRALAECLQAEQSSMRQLSAQAGRWRGTPSLVRCWGRDMMTSSRLQRRTALPYGVASSFRQANGGGGDWSALSASLGPPTAVAATTNDGIVGEKRLLVPGRHAATAARPSLWP